MFFVDRVSHSGKAEVILNENLSALCFVQSKAMSAMWRKAVSGASGQSGSHGFSSVGLTFS